MLLLACTGECCLLLFYTDVFVELRFESGSLQNRHQKPMVHTIEGLGLIKIDQLGFSVVFYPL